MSVAVEARNVVKRYGQQLAVKGVHLQIQEGECFGIVGSPGSGKTSLLRMMYCGSPLTSGELYVLGLNVKQNARKIKSQIGVMPEQNCLDDHLTVLDNLLVYATFFNISPKQAKTQARELLRFTHLEEFDGDLVESLNLEIQRRLCLARSLVSHPKIIFLDEPMIHLKPQSRVWVREAIVRLKNQQKTLVMTSGHFSEIQLLCDRILMIDKGEILCEGAPQELIQRYIGHEVVEFFLNAEDIEYYVEKIRHQFEYQVINNRLRIFVKSGQASRGLIGPIESSHMLVRKASLEDVFLLLAGYELNSRDIQ